MKQYIVLLIKNKFIKVDTLSYKTIAANKDTVVKEWVIVDATDMVLGRMGTKVAKLLRGKYKPNFHIIDDVNDCDGPCFVIFNHLSRIDHMYVCGVTHPRVTNMVAGYSEFYRKTSFGKRISSHGT